MKFSSQPLILVRRGYFKNPCPFILFSPLFQRIPQPAGHDQENGKQSHSQLPATPSGLTSRIRFVLFQ